jgi:hypothetical protein
MAEEFSLISPFVKANDKKFLARGDSYSDNAGCSRSIARRTSPSVEVGKEYGDM